VPLRSACRRLTARSSGPETYGGFGRLYDAKRSLRPITQAACWSHGRRKYFLLADLAKSAPGQKHGAPLVLDAVRRIDAIFAIEREINGLPAEQRLAVRTTCIAPLVSELESWMRGERAASMYPLIATARRNSIDP